MGVLLSNRTVKPGTRLDLVWNGLTAAGLLVPDGTYRPVVKLLRSHRTITLPSPIRLDTVPPKITVRHPQYPIISPDGDGHHDAFTFHYTIDEPAHAILLVRGDQVLFTRTSKQAGELTWNGRVEGGTRAPPGRYDAFHPSPRRTPRATGPRHIRSRLPRSVTSSSRARGSLSDRAAGSRCGYRPTRRGSVGNCTVATECSHAGRCISARPSPRASSTCTCSPARTRHAPPWWSDERGCGPGGRRDRCARARAAHRGAAPRSPRRGTGSVGTGLRGADGLPRAARASPPARGRCRAARTGRGDRHLGRAARPVAPCGRDSRLRARPHSGPRGGDGGEPAPAALRRRRRCRARACLGAVRRRFESVSRARSPRVAGRRVRRLGRGLAALVEGPPAGRDRAALLRASVRAAGSRARPARVVAGMGPRRCTSSWRSWRWSSQ